MKLDEFENRQLTQINKIDKQLNEGWGANVVNWFIKNRGLKKNLKKMAADIEDVPELKAQMDAIEKLGDEIEQTLKRTQDSHKQGLLDLAKHPGGTTRDFVERERKEWLKHLAKYRKKNRNYC